jgi:CRISPR-associated endonuclease/helicase Cas3
MPDFPDVFKQLTGNDPLSWQSRLHDEWFVQNKIPQIIDLPTGLGKTMVMAIWLIARQTNLSLPRRLIYVVDRRTVVDQATDLAEKLAKNAAIAGTELPAISTLRGQKADNREWTRDPSLPAIIIGTVDMIGSRLLFSGYRSSYKQRPLHAGLLGQDSLLLLDEAHLSKPFDKLLAGIEQFQQSRDRQGATLPVPPMQVIRMSATSRKPDNQHGVFALQLDDHGELAGEDANDHTIRDRYEAKKTLAIEESESVTDDIAASANALVKGNPGTRIVIFVKSPKDVEAIRKALIKKDKFCEKKIAHLTGTMRGLERDELLDTEKPVRENEHERRVMQRFLKPDNDPTQGECFLISTSAGEVGFDLNADHMVCDAAPIDSLIQRLGRVNRRGKGDAKVILVCEPAKKDKESKSKKLDLAIANTITLLQGVADVRPKKLTALKLTDWKDSYAAACSPNPIMLDLTDILLDNWSMTTLVEPMPGRPEVAPWLRGISEELPQTTIAWRAELDLFKDVSDPCKAFKAIFAKHPIRPHESLTVNSHRVIEFFNEVKKKRADLLGTRIVIKLSRDIVVRTIQQIINDDGILNVDPTLILPATFGGLEKGMLSHGAIPSAPETESPPPSSLDIADREGYEPTEHARARLRILIERTEDGWKPLPLPGGAALPPEIDLSSMDGKSTALFHAFTEVGFRVKLRQHVKFDEEDNAIQSLVCLSPVVQGKKPVNQPLSEHVGAVEREAIRIAGALQLPNLVRSAVLFAAKWHDEGKKADIWQYFIGYESGEPLGKGKYPRDPKSLRGYRHEFGSLLRIHHPERCDSAGCTPPADGDARELALHLIATHHGMGRPHFNNAVYAQFTDEERDATHTDAIRRFARLQKQHGWWHLAWLENLLRCADQLASAQAGSTGDEDETEDEA